MKACPVCGEPIANDDYTCINCQEQINFDESIPWNIVPNVKIHLCKCPECKVINYKNRKKEEN